MEKACKSGLSEMITYIHLNIQGDNNLLTKRYEKVLKSEQIVCYQKILNQIQKLGAVRKLFSNNYVWKLLILP